jgi:hypothetical protein
MPDTPQIALDEKTGQFFAHVNGQWVPTQIAVNETTGGSLAKIGGKWIPIGHLDISTSSPAIARPAKSSTKSQPGWGEWAARTALKYAPSTLLTGGGAVAGAEAGAGLGSVVGGPPGAVIGGALGGIAGAGLGSGASEYLPESMGGAKQPSFKRGFLWGAIPQAAIPVAGAVVRPLVKTGETAAAAQKEAIEKAIEAAKETGGEAIHAWNKQIGEAAKSVEEAKQNFRSWLEKQIGTRLAKQRLQSIMPAPTEYPDPSGRGAESLAQTAKELTQTARAKSGGEALGKAYETLKLPETAQINVDELPRSIQAIRNDLHGPISPGTEKLLRRAENIGFKSAIDTPDGLEELSRQASSSDILHLRQEASKALAKASGTDRYALQRLIDSLDNHLEPHLPPEVQALRRQYRGIMRVLPYDVERKLGGAIRPSEAAEVIFDTPERALAIIRQVKDPADQQILREGFAQKIFSAVDPFKSVDNQLLDIQKALQPYLAKDVAGRSVVRELYGPNAEQEIRNLMNAPINGVRLSALFANPESRRVVLDEMKRTIMNDPQWAKHVAAVKQAVATLQEEAEQASEKLGKSTTEAIQQLQKSGTKSPYEARVQAIKKRLRGGPGGFLRYFQHRGMYLALEGAFMGYGVGSGHWTIAGLASIPLLWTAAMRTGAGSALARYLASPTARQAGRNLAQLLIAIGSQTARQSAEHISEEPVEMPASAATGTGG